MLRRLFVRGASVLPGLWIVAAGAGCRYTADVRNATPEPVLVRMVQKQSLKNDWMMDTTRLAPGERARLGPGRSTAGRVFVEAGERTRTEEPVTRKIGAGRTELEVALAEDGRSLVIRRIRKHEGGSPAGGEPGGADPREVRR